MCEKPPLHTLVHIDWGRSTNPHVQDRLQQSCRHLSRPLPSRRVSSCPAKMQGCPAVIRPASRDALAPKSGATAKAGRPTKEAPHPASGVREHSFSWRLCAPLGRASIPTQRPMGLITSRAKSLGPLRYVIARLGWVAHGTR